MQGLSGALRPALETYSLNATNFLLPPTKGIESGFLSHLLRVAKPYAAARPRSDGSVGCLAFGLLPREKDSCPKRLERSRH